MAEVSQRAVGLQLGKTGEVSQRALAEDGYTRTFAVEGYLVVNPFQVALGQADDPSLPADSLNAWDGYDHSAIPTGDDLVATSGYGEIDVSFTRPSGYTEELSVVDQKVYAKDTGETTINATALAVNPFSSPDTSPSIGDGTTGTASGLTEGEVAAVGVKVEFDDSVTVHTNADSVAYDYDPGEDPLLGAGRGVAVLVFGGNPGPLTCIQSASTPAASCAVGDNVTLEISYNMEGTSTGRLEQSKNGGGWTLVSASVTAGSSQSTVSRASDGANYAYRLRYNDVSPDDWATQVGTTSPQCDLL